ncbi:MAG: YcfA family protein [Parcubacteria group bacterium Greene0416_79]|nr:MAG: YcfA family protein [Parcubacteria group bacterium Greene0416_79]
MLPVLKATEIIRTLLKAGFKIIRSRGSHYRFEHPVTKRRATVSFHGGDVPKKTLCSILNQAGLTVQEFLRYLREK